MTPGLTSIIIPTYNHGTFILDAVQSAALQTATVEIIVVDDGSTDETEDILSNVISDLVYIRRPHAGPSAARNAGIDAARGEFVMFLDADDVITSNKVATQLEALTEDLGWVLCDVRIEDEAKGKTENASAKYGYAAKDLGGRRAAAPPHQGWIRPLLEPGNFIPIMSPLVRRSVLGDSIRFRDEHVPEDFHFWLEVAAVARVGYVDQVLATYRHRRTGRSRLPKVARVVTPNYEAPLRLNLGCGDQANDSWHPLAGLVNLDKSMGWRFEDGLGDFLDGSVAGITISHVLMYIEEKHWPHIFAELARVLEPGGVLRITEDDTTHPKSARRGGWKGSHPFVTLTDGAKIRTYLERAGLTAHDGTQSSTLYRDRSLCQENYGKPPNVFVIEGVRERCVLFSPHNDDEALFASFTILRFRPDVVICYPSGGDYGDTETRAAESRDACSILCARSVRQWDGTEAIVRRMQELDEKESPTRVFAPDPRTSHEDHLHVARCAAAVFGSRVTTYHTYEHHTQGLEKVRSGPEVPFEPIWLQHKLRALARYTSQLSHPRANQFFAMDLREYHGQGAR